MTARIGYPERAWAELRPCGPGPLREFPATKSEPLSLVFKRFGSRVSIVAAVEVDQWSRHHLDLDLSSH